ncbi:hypothetical protein HW132_18155 [Brasilonema sp. CT11]|nr:hypothetical protein [Brasilonema sp. CT11]
MDLNFNSFLQASDNIDIVSTDILYLTDKTVRFGADVYQFRNVTGFGIGEVKPKKVPFTTILGLFIFGLVLYPLSSFLGGLGTFLSLLMLLIPVAMLVSNLTQPKLFGLKLHLNSGEGKIFITNDTKWLEKAVSKLYQFMENIQDGSSMTIQIGGSITGNIIQGSERVENVSNYDNS